MPGVTAAAPVVSAPVIAGEVSGTFLALPAGRIAEVVHALVAQRDVAQRMAPAERLP